MVIVGARGWFRSEMGIARRREAGMTSMAINRATVVDRGDGHLGVGARGVPG